MYLFAFPGQFISPTIWLDLVRLPRQTQLIVGVAPGGTWECRGDMRGFQPSVASVLQQLQHCHHWHSLPCEALLSQAPALMVLL